ncbi:hypothetical protein ACFQ8C_24910 [Streptomyces sp. NPDC056503]|uniref:hypothetical protein n=1 Tax=Streptomyces sp. NPDC056503 TaxID=3345842 RepID=UPI0036C60E12
MAGRSIRAPRWWLETPNPIRWVLKVCLPLGILAIALGIYGDGHGWWDDRSFLTNLASSFASLLFGVPLALVGLSHLGSLQAEAANRMTAERRGREAARDFQRVVLTGFNRAPRHQALEDISAFQRVNHRLRQLTQGWAEDRSPERAREMLLTLDARTDAFHVAFRYPEIHRWTSAISHSWHRIDKEVRPFLENAEVWRVSPTQHAELRRAARLLDGIEGKHLALQHDPTRDPFRRYADPRAGEAVPRPSDADSKVEQLRQSAEAVHDLCLALGAIREWMLTQESIGR